MMLAILDHEGVVAADKPTDFKAERRTIAAPGTWTQLSRKKAA
jgi:hypothetical protein